MQPGLRQVFQKESTILIIILLLALVNGLLYITIVPPWQHYDEPNHFEAVWLLADRGRLPKPGDYDSGMRRAVARSMIAHGFFDGWGSEPDLNTEKSWIGRFSQLDEPPIYYLLASIPLQILPIDDVTQQLYLARLVSLALLLVTVFAGWGFTAEMTAPGHALRFLVPLTLALLPGFVDLMTSVNNDAGAIAAFSLFLWGCTRLVRRGPSWGSTLWVLAACALCLFTKRSVYLGLPVLGVSLLFGFLRGRFRKAAWGLVIAAGIAAGLAVFSWGDAARWYGDTSQNTSTRIRLQGAPEGEAAFKLIVQPEDPTVKLVQMISPETAEGLRDKPLTLGVWIWASQPIEINSAQLRVYPGETYGTKIQIGQTPQFYAVQFTPTGDTTRSWVQLAPGKRMAVEAPVEITYDGLVLAQGSYPTSSAPQFEQGGASGTWDGAPFVNLVHNPSAEHAWLTLRPWADQIGSRLFSDYEGQESFSLTIYSLMDLPVTQQYYRLVMANLFRTFWGKFGWAHVPLLGGKPYAWFLIPATLLAFVGLGLAFWQQRQQLGKLPWDGIFLSGLTISLFWGITLLRGSTYLLTKVYVPVARYAYPAIVPTVLFLCTGWLVLLERPAGWLRLPGWVKYAVYTGFFLVLNVFALLSIAQFYGQAG